MEKKIKISFGKEDVLKEELYNDVNFEALFIKMILDNTKLNQMSKKHRIPNQIITKEYKKVLKSCDKVLRLYLSTYNKECYKKDYDKSIEKNVMDAYLIKRFEQEIKEPNLGKYATLVEEELKEIYQKIIQGNISINSIVIKYNTNSYGLKKLLLELYPEDSEEYNRLYETINMNKIDEEKYLEYKQKIIDGEMSLEELSQKIKTTTATLKKKMLKLHENESEENIKFLNSVNKTITKEKLLEYKMKIINKEMTLEEVIELLGKNSKYLRNTMNKLHSNDSPEQRAFKKATKKEYIATKGVRRKIIDNKILREYKNKITNHEITKSEAARELKVSNKYLTDVLLELDPLDSDLNKSYLEALAKNRRDVIVNEEELIEYKQKITKKEIRIIEAAKILGMHKETLKMKLLKLHEEGSIENDEFCLALRTNVGVKVKKIDEEVLKQTKQDILNGKILLKDAVISLDISRYNLKNKLIELECVDSIEEEELENAILKNRGKFNAKKVDIDLELARKCKNLLLSGTINKNEAAKMLGLSASYAGKVIYELDHPNSDENLQLKRILNSNKGKNRMSATRGKVIMHKVLIMILDGKNLSDIAEEYNIMQEELEAYYQEFLNEGKLQDEKLVKYLKVYKEKNEEDGFLESDEKKNIDTYIKKTYISPIKIEFKER